ncbi:NADP-dependent oxidoreductase [Schumannella luteola]|uniref:NADP-dependent oxidoreductase n=2 Tax=Protaetiibacter mangrovi TaxID=2970926 RepID=A0ABT1ZG29_9MICO|nr:NADP-dependent oxidoreductase [Protaetiibacter mangrovi]MCS0499650.1 NADP-dependent oxidoreductase [Protaetiibacter mangrovi]TPX04360.1 NADP-dependent oxidoreductase [Schumannella luteola]
MRAVTMAAPGGPEVLETSEVEAPTRVNAEFLIKVIAAGVNPVDAKTRAGHGAWAGVTTTPVVLGNDFSGIVVEAPYESHPLQPGTEVYGMGMVPRMSGAYAEYLTVTALSVARKPPSLSHVEAAAVPLAALTAWGMVVETAKAHEGQRMLIHAGAGGVGHFAVQFASYFGAHVIATGSARNAAFLTELGAAEVVDYTAGPFEEAIDPVDVVIDLVGNAGGDTGSRSLAVLRPGALYVNGPTGSFPTMSAEAEALGVRATGFRVAPDAATLSIVTRLIESGDVRVFVDRVLPLEEAAEAHRLIESGHTRGKIVLAVADV